MEGIVGKGMLYDCYGALLTRRQQEIYEDVVYHDLSLTEIAELRGISKQGVSDLLRRSTKTLETCEQKLGLVKRFQNIETLCDRVEETLADETSFSKEQAKMIKRLTAQLRKELR